MDTIEHRLGEQILKAFWQANKNVPHASKCIASVTIPIAFKEHKHLWNMRIELDVPFFCVLDDEGRPKTIDMNEWGLDQ